MSSGTDNYERPDLSVWTKEIKTGTTGSGPNGEHYGGSQNPYEAIKVIEAWACGFHIGNCLKYICRAGKKPGESSLKDLEKARWYLDRQIGNLKGGRIEK